MREYLFRGFHPDENGIRTITLKGNKIKGEWAEEKFFEILNARYNAQKPTVFSSNYSIGELASVLGLDKAIVERINEMATRVLKLDGDDFRTAARSDKNDIARRLGV